LRHSRLRRASESAAALVLEDLGYRVVEVRRPLLVEGVEVSDIDIVAEKDGRLYAVEVKAGSADVSAVRQAYTNALLAGMRPLIVARGADDKARAVAEKLGVEIVALPDLLVAGYEDLREAVREALLSVIDEFSSIILEACGNMSPEEARALEALASSETIRDLAEKLGTSIEGAAKTLSKLRGRGLLQTGKFPTLRLSARLILALCPQARPPGEREGM